MRSWPPSTPSVITAVNDHAEADQVMYTLAKRYEESGHTVIIYSGDNDMLQSLTENISIYRGRSKDGEQWITLQDYYETEKMVKKFGGCPVESLPYIQSPSGRQLHNLRGGREIPRDLVRQIAPILDLSDPAQPSQS